jgi:hypothetical protein
MSFNTSLSRLRSATRRFSFAFSCSNSFNRFAWSICNPPYSLRQPEISLLHDLRFFAGLRHRLPVRYRHFDLSQQVLLADLIDDEEIDVRKWKARK